MEWLPNTITGEYKYTTQGSRKKYTGIQFGHKLNAHQVSREEGFRTFSRSSQTKEEIWIVQQWPVELFEDKYFIPCLALDFIEL